MKHKNAIYTKLQSQPDFYDLSILLPANLEHCSQSFGFPPWPRIGAGKSRMRLLRVLNLFPLHLSGLIHRQEYFPIYS